MPHQPHPWQSPEAVSQFLHNVRGTIPLSIEQIDMLLRLVGAARGEQVERFLDLGCGEGVLSAALLDEYPEARGWLDTVELLAGSEQAPGPHDQEGDQHHEGDHVGEKRIDILNSEHLA